MSGLQPGMTHAPEVATPQTRKPDRQPHLSPVHAGGRFYGFDMDFHCTIPTVRDDVELIRQVMFSKSAQKGNRSAVVLALLLPAIERWKIENAARIEAWESEREASK